MIPEIKEAFYTKNPNFKKMMKIITSFQNTPALEFDNLERHHIVPKSFYKKLGIPVNGSSDNLVKLPFSEHMTVHFYAAECAKPIIKDAMLRAKNNFFKLKNVDEDFVLKHKSEFDKSRNLVSDAWQTWAKDNDPENYQRYLDHKYKKEMWLLRKKFRLGFKNRYPKGARKCISTLQRISKKIETPKPEKPKHEYKKVICINTGEIFNSTGDAGRKMGLSGTCISTVCQHSGRHKTVKGFIFEYLENYDPKKVYEHSKTNIERRRPVVCIETGQKFESVEACGKVLKIDKNSILKVCHRKMTKTHCFHFVWAEDYLEYKERPRKKRETFSNAKKVFCKETNCLYQSASECARKLGVSPGGVLNCCHKRTDSIKGFHVRWA